MRIALILHLAQRDGAGKANLELAAGLRLRGVEIWAVVPKRGPLSEDLVALGVPVITVPYRWWIERDTGAPKKLARTLWNLLMVAPLAVCLARRGCDVVYSSTVTVATGALAARLLGLPHVWHFHELWRTETGFAFDLGERLSLRLVDRLSDACIACSNVVRHELAPHVHPGKLHVVYQAVTVPEPASGQDSPPPPAAPGVLTCAVLGTIFPLKRQEDAIRAVALLARRAVAVRLWLIGEEREPYATELRLLAAAEGIGASVSFLGFHADPFPLLRAADVVLSCAALEAFGRATVEAMLLGKPVIAARAGGNAELVEDGRNGLLYEPAHPEELAARIAEMAAAPEQRRRLGEAGRRLAQATFTRDAFADGVLAILEQVTLAHARGRGEASRGKR